MTTRLEVIDHGERLSFSFEDLMRYHGSGSPGGVAHGFKVLERALALARRLAEEGVEASASRDVVRLVKAGNPLATHLVREAGRNLGQVLAGCVNFFNPGVIVIGGDLGQASEQLLAGVREVTFSRSLPLATEELRVVPSRLGDRAGVIGAAIMAIEHVLSPDAIDRAIQRGVAA